MNRIKNLAAQRPLLFAILATILWIVISGITAFLATIVLGLPIGHAAVQSFGTLAATLIFVSAAWRWGWLKAAGLARLGGWRLWAVTLLLMVYLTTVYTYAFFDEISFNFSVLKFSSAARTILLRQIIVGIVEETFFRGIILYTLIRVWGRTRKGIFLSILVSALIFSVPHILQLAAGQPLNFTLASTVNSFVSGAWLAALVLIGGSIWPGALLHTASNSAAIIPTLSTTSADHTVIPYIQTTLLEIPILITGIWLALCTAPRPVVPDAP